MQLGRGEVSGLPQQCFITLIDQTPEEMGARAGYWEKEGKKNWKQRFFFSSFTSSHTFVIFFLEENTPGKKGSPNVSPSWLPSQSAAWCPGSLIRVEEPLSDPPLRDANLITKLCKV
jgi:hypothetical protein